MPNLNVRIFEFINNAAGYYRPLDIFFVVITSYVTLWIVGIAVGCYFIFYLPMQQEEGMARIRAFRNAWRIVWSVFLTFVAVEIIKALVAFPRPFQVLQNIHVLISLPDSYSFPSGHAAITMALATVVYPYKKQLGLLLALFAFIVGFARIYVGVHYPIDVIAGFLIGFVIPKLVYLTKNKKHLE